MKKFLIVTIMVLFTYSARSDLGFGLMLGDPTAITVKSRSGGSNDFIFNFGLKQHYGSLRLDGIYTFNFPNVINSRQFELYAGIGAVIAIGQGDGFFDDKHHHHNFKDGEIGIGAKGVFGVNFNPSKDFEIFLELGPLVSVVPGVYSDLEGSIGFRFYP